jgi:hypothetical protein
MVAILICKSIGECCVDWKSKTLVSASTISSGESEYYGGSECGRTSVSGEDDYRIS